MDISFKLKKFAKKDIVSVFKSRQMTNYMGCINGCLVNALRSFGFFYPTLGQIGVENLRHESSYLNSTYSFRNTPLNTLEDLIDNVTAMVTR